jgi:hypothetical protein
MQAVSETAHSLADPTLPLPLHYRVQVHYRVQEANVERK